jgi:large subunit ribosomal protein L25
MEKQTLSAEVRDGRGKGPARQLRMQGRIPAVFYGPGVETKALSVSPKELVKALGTEWGMNAVIELSFDGVTERVMIKDVQVHPLDRQPLHVDLYRVTDESRVHVRVPVATRGRPLGVQKGGRMTVVFRDLPVRCTPATVPAAIEVEVSDLDMGGVLRVRDLSLPEGVTVLLDPDRRLILVGEDKRKAELEAEEKAAAEAAAAEAAPAEADAPPPPVEPDKK